MSAGDLARITGSGQGLPGTTASVVDVGTIVSDPGSILTETSAGRFTPQAEGYYLVTARGRFDTTHNNRLNIAWEITFNGSSLAGNGGTSYARNNANPYAYPQAAAILYFNGSTDYFEVEHIRDTGAGTPAGSYNFTRAKIVHLADGAAASTPYGRYSTPADGIYTGTTPTAVSGWDAVTETDTSVIEVQAGGTAIRLKEANRPYLIVYSLKNDDAGGARTQRLSDVTLAGTRVGHSTGYAYQRDSANQRAYPNGIALVRPTSANQDINVRAWGYSISTTWWGVFNDGSWSLAQAASQAGVMVIALPSTTDIAIFEDGTGNQAVAGATDVTLNAMRTTVTADSPFTRDNNTDVTVSTSTDVFAYASGLIERQTASGVRNTSALRWVKETVEITESGFGSYLRGDQSTQDTPNMVLSSIFCDSATAGDTFQVEKYDPGTDDGANDFTWAGTGPAVGAFFIDLSSLAAASGPQTWTGSPGVVELVAASGSFVAGAVVWTGSVAVIEAVAVSGSFVAGTTVWNGSTGVVELAATSGSFTPGPVVWSGSTGVIELAATSGTFVADQTWTGTTGVIELAATSGSFIAAGSTWNGSTGILELAATSGVFGNVSDWSNILTTTTLGTGPQTWNGSTGVVELVATSGSFIADQTWTGSTAVVELVAVSGSFVAGPVVWTGNSAIIELVATSGVFTPGTSVWTGTTAVVELAATSGTFVSDGAPQTWTGTAGTIELVATSGTFIPGAVTWTGTSGVVELVATSGSFIAEGAPQTWTGTTGTLELVATSGFFVADQTWTGTPAVIELAAVSGTFTAGPIVWTGNTGIVELEATSGTFTAGTAIWTGTPAVVELVGTSGTFIPGAVTWTGTPAVIELAATSGTFIDLSDNLRIIAERTVTRYDLERTVTRTHLERSVDRYDVDRTVERVGDNRTVDRVDADRTAHTV